jgi:hypothetical protein
MRQELIAPGDLRDFTYRRSDIQSFGTRNAMDVAPPSPSLLESRWK